MMPRRVIFFALLATVWATHPALASGTNLEEINHHQAGASASLLMGDHTLLQQGEFSFSGHGYVSSWATDALYGSLGASFQAQPWQRWTLGISYSYTEAQLHTRGWLLNAQYSLLGGATPWLHVQAALGHRYLDSSESGNAVIFEFDNPWPIRPGNPEILLDDMNWTQGYLNALFHTKLWRFQPQFSLGYVFSHYSWSGWEVPLFGGLDNGPGPALSDSGETETVIWSLGLGLDLDPVRPFVGLGSFSAGGLFLARISIVF
jgi:hypothetical protein